MNSIKRGDNADAKSSGRAELIPALALVACAQLVSWTGLQLTPTLGGPVLVGMTHSLSFAGLPLGVAFLSSAASAAVAQRVVARIRMGAFLGIGALLGALGTTFSAASTVSNAPTMLIVGIVIAGLGIGWCWLTRYEAARLLGPVRGRMALGLVVGVAGIGAVSGPLTIPLLKQASTAVGLAPSTLPWLLVTLLFIALAVAALRVKGNQVRRPRPKPLAYIAVSIRLAAIKEAEKRRLFQGRADTLGQLVGGVAPIGAGLFVARTSFAALMIGLVTLSFAAALIGARRTSG